MAIAPLYKLIVYVLAETDEVVITTREKFWSDDNELVQELANILLKTNSLMDARKVANEKLIELVGSGQTKYRLVEQIDKYKVY